MDIIFRHGLWGSILSSFYGKRYAHLPASESKEDELDHDLEIPTMKMWSTIHVLLMILTTMAFSGGAGFAVGMVSLRSTGREFMGNLQPHLPIARFKEEFFDNLLLQLQQERSDFP